MNNKKSIILTAIITFAVTSAVFIGGYFVYNSPMLSLLGIGIKGNYSADMVKRAGEIIKGSYYEDVDTDKLYEAALHGMMSSLGDEYSWFVNEESFEELMSTMGGEYTGIGVQVSIDPADNLITVIAPIEDTPAYKAGIKPGDKLLAIGGTDVNFDNYQEAIRMMRGNAESIGEEIKLDIKRADTGNPEQITLIRELIMLKTVKSKMLPNDIGYIRITSFDEKTGTEFKDHLALLQGETDIKGLVIDLRNNGGGTITSLEQIADMLLPEGLITYFEYKDGTRQEFTSDASCLEIPVSVLINGSSASASEVLSGALRDHKKATLVGEKSFGKGIVQTVLPFITTPKGKTAIYITTAKYYTPNGECIHGKGITPDIEISLAEEYKNAAFDDLTLEQDIQLKAAWGEVARQIN